MELDAPTVPAAIARYARLNAPETRAALVASMAWFEHRFRDDPDAAFAARYRHDVLPGDIGQDAAGFFAMVRALLDDPGGFARYERAL